MREHDKMLVEEKNKAIEKLRDDIREFDETIDIVERAKEAISLELARVEQKLFGLYKSREYLEEYYESIKDKIRVIEEKYED